MSALYSGGKDGVSIAVTATSLATKITVDAYDDFCDEIVVQNMSDNPVYIKTGGAGTVATTTSLMVPAQWRETFSKRQGATHLAAICASGQTANLVVFCVPEED